MEGGLLVILIIKANMEGVLLVILIIKVFIKNQGLEWPILGHSFLARRLFYRIENQRHLSPRH